MARFRKKPVVVEAMQFDGSNAHEVCEWVTGKKIANPFALSKGVWIKQVVIDETVDPIQCIHKLVIPTLEGEHEASPGDWIIRGVKGEHYPCKPDIFAQTYEPAD